MTYINQNAFIMTAIYGKEYCSAAVKAFSLLLSNKLRALILYTISLYLMLVSKLCVSFLTGVGAYYFFQCKLPFFEEFTNIHFIWTPVLVRELARPSAGNFHNFANLHSAGHHADHLHDHRSVPGHL